MKRIAVFALFAIALLSAATKAGAQKTVVLVDVPFDFFVGTRSMPAGQYSFAPDGSSFMAVREKHSGVTVKIAATQSQRDPGQGASVVFDRIGDQYILHRVLSASSQRLNVDVPTWKPRKWRNERVALEKQEVLIQAE